MDGAASAPLRCAGQIYMLMNAIFAKRRIAACVYCFTWTNRILSRTLP